MLFFNPLTATEEDERQKRQPPDLGRTGFGPGPISKAQTVSISVYT